MSANDIQRMLQEVDLGYRRTALLSDVRHWKEAFLQGELMKYTTMDAKLGEDRYMETTWRQTSIYETKFRGMMKDPLTGEITEKYVIVRHQHEEDGMIVDDLTQTKTRRELQEQAEEYFKHTTWKDLELIGEPVPMMGMYNPGMF